MAASVAGMHGNMQDVTPLATWMIGRGSTSKDLGKRTELGTVKDGIAVQGSTDQLAIIKTTKIGSFPLAGFGALFTLLPPTAVGDGKPYLKEMSG